MYSTIMFPAFRFRQAGRDYYVATMDFHMAEALLDRHVDWSQRIFELSEDNIAQRDLARDRIRKMVEYLAQEDHFYPPIIAELVTDRIRFDPNQDNEVLGVLTITASDLILIVDGQHRLQSIREAIRKGTDLSQDHITIVFRRFESVEQSQKLFTDINRNQSPVNKELTVYMDRRSLTSDIARRVSRQWKLAEYVNFGTSRIKRKGSMFKLNAIEQATEMLIPVVGENPEEHVRFWDRLFSCFPEIQMLTEGHISLNTLKRSMVLPSNTVLKGIALARLMAHHEGISEDDFIEAVSRIDWRREGGDFDILKNGLNNTIIKSHDAEEYIPKLILNRAREIAKTRV